MEDRVELTIDGQVTTVTAGTTILQASQAIGRDIPTLCYLETLTPVNACRLCVVELDGARTLIPSCARRAQSGMTVQTDSPRVRTSRKLVLELLASSVDLTTAGPEVSRWMMQYSVDPGRFGEPETSDVAIDESHAGRHGRAVISGAETTAQPVKRDNNLYIRDYSKCILCYKCVEACGADAQNTFAITVAGRGFDAHISTEFDAPLPDSACVYCGNCIAVCPTGALMFVTEFEMRAEGTWDESTQTVTRTVCPYCGVGCNLDLHVQDNRIVKVTSPLDHDVTSGNLCIKGRFGFEYVQNRPKDG